MAAEQYVRYDVRVEVRPSRSGGAVIDLGGGAPVRLTAASLREWRAGGPVPSPLWSTSPLSRRLARALADRPAGTLARIVLDLRGSEVIPLPWEAALPGSAPIVRASPARPRVLETPLTFPLRMLRLDPSESRTPTHDLDRTIRSIMPADSDDAAIVGRTEAARTGEFLTLWAWPSVEVIEVSAATLAPAGTSAAGAPRGLLSTAEPDRAGTLGWFERLAAGYQVRLLVVDCQTLREAADARLLAAALVARGGPAVVVADRAWPATLHAFYAQIIHDRPIDLACGTAGPGLGLTVGRHGEEALRISRVVGDLQALSRRLADPAGDPELRALRRTLEGAGRSADLDALAHTLPEFGYDTMRYETESGGFVPLSRHLAWVRSVSGLGRVGLGGGVVDRPAAPATEARYLNIGLHTDEDPPRPLPSRGGPLDPGVAYLLGVDVGPRDPDRTPAGALALVEEVFAWEPGQDGAWAEVAVIGIDFDVVGEPVRQLWVPRNGPSQRIHFTVVPRREGPNALRVCLYVGTNIVQSVRLGALAGDPGPTGPADLAELLDLTADDVGGASWKARTEYATRDLGGATAQPGDRALSLVVNDLAGRSVVTVKGPDILLTEVKIHAGVPGLVTRVRQALEDLSTPPAEPHVLEQDRPYGYGADDDPNAGPPDRFDADMFLLAEVGWSLYDAIVPGDENARARIAELLDVDPRPIHIAHIHLENVIPWAVAYDRCYDPRRRRSNGQAVTRGTCPAGLPGDDGRMPVGRCGELAGCLLAGTEEERRSAARDTGAPLYIDSTVVCARRFWGFRHQIELPVQQMRGSDADIPETARELRADPILRMAIGMNGGLYKHGDHLQELRKTVTDADRTTLIVSERYDADDVKDSLAPVDLDIVYLYCHADGGYGTTIDPPILRFRMPGEDQDRPVAAADLDAGAWLHRPLIVLNGCRTANFRPDALSPFLRKFVRDRHAGALLGTEISVWEQLATEVGRKFLDAFLGGQAAGAALLRIRQDLLARRNPLGLAYTLYADVDFALAAPAERPPVHVVGLEPVSA